MNNQHEQFFITYLALLPLVHYIPLIKRLIHFKSSLVNSLVTTAIIVAIMNYLLRPIVADAFQRFKTRESES